jgi:archaemetzincin
VELLFSNRTGKVLVICFPYCLSEEKEAIEKYIASRLGFGVGFIDHGSYLPSELYDSWRGQYRSEDVLDYLSSLRLGSLTIAIIKEDAYVYGYNYVFGHADPKRGVCAVYTKRISGQGGDEYILRLVKETLHELGHLLGLDHCNNRECVMSFSRNLAEVDRKKPIYCSSCLAKLNKGIAGFR